MLYQGLVLSTMKDEDAAQAILDVFSSFITDEISDFNSNVYYTNPDYDAYRKAGYSKRFLEAHREEITLHKAAKAAFDEAGLKKLPKTKDLSIEYAELLKKKKEAYPDYRKAQDEMQELMKAQKNVEMFFAEEKDTAEKEPTR